MLISSRNTVSQQKQLNNRLSKVNSQQQAWVVVRRLCDLWHLRRKMAV
jgi:hypothetical protein